MTVSKPRRDEQGLEVEAHSELAVEEAAALAVAGAAIGAIAGPAPALAGAIVATSAGLLEARLAPQCIDSVAEMQFWLENYQKRYYFSIDREWKDYEIAYQLGINYFEQGKDYEELRCVVESRWEELRGDSELIWTEASDASRDAWKRLAVGRL